MEKYKWFYTVFPQNVKSKQAALDTYQIHILEENAVKDFATLYCKLYEHPRKSLAELGWMEALIESYGKNFDLNLGIARVLVSFLKDLGQAVALQSLQSPELSGLLQEQTAIDTELSSESRSVLRHEQRRDGERLLEKLSGISEALKEKEALVTDQHSLMANLKEQLRLCEVKCGKTTEEIDLLTTEARETKAEYESVQESLIQQA